VVTVRGTDDDRRSAHVAPPSSRWLDLAGNRFWLLVPILVLNLALTNLLPPPLSPGSAGPGTAGWLSVSESALRIVVFGTPLLMPLSRREPLSRFAVVVYAVGLGVYVASWVAVVWAPASPWSTSVVGLTALAWTSITFLTGIGIGSRLRFAPWYRPWMYMSAAAVFSVVHTAPMVITWNSYY
jgi:hypothetical protein